MLRPVPDRASGDDGDGRRTGCALGLCEGNGFILRDDGEAVPCECRDGLIGRRVSRGMGTGIPSRYREVAFSRKPICDLDPLVLRHVRAFVDDIEANLRAGRGLWFTGDVGTGKTSLAMLVSKAAERVGNSVAIYPVTRLLAEIKDTYDRDATGSYMSLFHKLCAVDLLHLDDLGAERRTDWVLEQLYSIVNERWQDERSIVVTTNIIDLDELREEIGARTVSRLVEICGSPIPLMGPDLRLTSSG
jgi:DNA replication protein DnaC